MFVLKTVAPKKLNLAALDSYCLFIVVNGPKKILNFEIGVYI